MIVKVPFASACVMGFTPHMKWAEALLASFSAATGSLILLNFDSKYYLCGIVNVVVCSSVI